MTAKDKLIQEQRRRIAGLEEELSQIVECFRLCRFCKNLDADCSPTGTDCKPEWRGLHGDEP